MTPPPSRAPTKQPAVLLSPVLSIEPQFATSPSPPPSTQARRPVPIGKRGLASRHGKPTLVKKTAVDRFNDSRQDESRRLNLKRKMEHDEKMASIRLKRHKYDLQYGPQTPASSTPALVTAAATAEDKQIEILRLQIRLAELTRDNSAHVSMTHTSSHMPHAASSLASTSQMLQNSLEDVSTPSSGMSSLSYVSHNGFDSNNFITSEHTGRYVPNDEASRDTTSWPETYDFTT
jgi:hypothetical protein